MKILRLLLTFILIYIVASTGANAQLLWKISGEKIQDSYLFGTIHLLCQDDLYLPEELKANLLSSDQLVMELDSDDPDMMTEVQKFIFLENGHTLDDYLSDEELEDISQFFMDNLNLPMANLMRIKPFMLTSMLIPALMDCPVASYENSLTQLAQSNEIEILGLETVQEQMALLDSFPQEDMANMLFETIEDPESSRAEFNELVEAYKTHNPETLNAMMEEQMEEEEMKAFSRIMITSRNQSWVPRIVTLAKDKSTFFAVGAGHLGGPEGLLTLLESAGFKLEPVITD